MKSKNPRTDLIEQTRRQFNQPGGPAYGDMMALAKTLESKLSEVLCICGVCGVGFQLGNRCDHCDSVWKNGGNIEKIRADLNLIKPHAEAISVFVAHIPILAKLIREKHKCLTEEESKDHAIANMLHWITA